MKNKMLREHHMEQAFGFGVMTGVMIGMFCLCLALEFFFPEETDHHISTIMLMSSVTLGLVFFFKFVDNINEADSYE